MSAGTVFFPDAGTFLDLLAVSHEAPVLPLASISGCIDRAAARLFGVGSQGPGFYQKWATDGLDGFNECPVLRPVAFQEAREAFRDRASARFQGLAPIVGRLAVALARVGRLAINDKVVDVAIALEGVYALPRRKKQRRLEGRVSGFLGAYTEEGPRIRENIRMLYETRSDIVHGGSGEVSPLRKGAAFVTGFELARRSLFKLLRDGVPQDWDEVVAKGERPAREPELGGSEGSVRAPTARVGACAARAKCRLQNGFHRPTPCAVRKRDWTPFGA